MLPDASPVPLGPGVGAASMAGGKKARPAYTWETLSLGTLGSGGSKSLKSESLLAPTWPARRRSSRRRLDAAFWSIWVRRRGVRRSGQTYRAITIGPQTLSQ